MADHTVRQARLRPPIRLGRRHKWWVYSIFVALWCSGCVWLLLHYFLQVQGSFGPRPHPLQPWSLRLHGLAAMLSLLALGSVLPQHVHGAWTQARNRLPGGVLMLSMAWLTATGYALYYFVAAINTAWLSILHWLPGLVMPAVLWLHIRKGRAGQRGRCSSQSGPGGSSAIHRLPARDNRTGTG